MAKYESEYPRIEQNDVCFSAKVMLDTHLKLVFAEWVSLPMFSLPVIPWKW